jgi:hypothetical protein
VKTHSDRKSAAPLGAALFHAGCIGGAAKEEIVTCPLAPCSRMRWTSGQVKPQTVANKEFFHLSTWTSEKDTGTPHDGIQPYLSAT